MYLLEVYKNKLKIFSKTFNHEDELNQDQYRRFVSLSSGIQNTMDQITVLVNKVKAEKEKIEKMAKNESKEVVEQNGGEGGKMKMGNDQFLNTLYKMFPNELSRKL